MKKIIDFYFLLISAAFIIGMIIIIDWSQWQIFTCDEVLLIVLPALPNIIVFIVSLYHLLSGQSRLSVLTIITYIIYSLLYAFATFVILPIAHAVYGIHLLARALCCVNVIFTLVSIKIF